MWPWNKQPTRSTSGTNVNLVTTGTAAGARSKNKPAVLSPLADGLTVSHKANRSTTSVSAVPSRPVTPGVENMETSLQVPTAATDEAMPAGTKKQRPKGQRRRKKHLDVAIGDQEKRLTTRILPTDDPIMKKKKQSAHKRIERQKKRRKRQLEAKRRAERVQPDVPPEVDFTQYTEEEIAIISNVLERQLLLSRDVNCVERGLHQRASNRRPSKSPEPEDYSEVCTTCNRVRHCGLVHPLSGKKMLWICEADQYERMCQLYSGGWFHKQDSVYDLHQTSHMLERLTKLRHVGLSEDIDFMAHHESPVGTVKLRLLYTEDVQCLMVSVLQANDLDIKTSCYHPQSHIIAEVHIMPHHRSESFTHTHRCEMTTSPKADQIYIWMGLPPEQLAESKLRVSFWLVPTYAECEGYTPPAKSNRLFSYLIGLTEFPLPSVPLNDIEFCLSLFPGAGKYVYLPDKADTETDSEDDDKKDDEVESDGGKKKGLFGRFGGKKKKGKAATTMDAKKKRKQTMTVVQTEVLKGGKVNTSATSLKWTFGVFKEVIARENEDKIREAELRRNKQLQSDDDDHRAGRQATMMQLKDKMMSEGGAGQKKSKLALATIGSMSSGNTATSPVHHGSKLLDLAEEFSKDHTEYTSPLYSGKDYRLEENRNSEDQRDQMLSFIRRQYDFMSRTKEPSKSIESLRVQVERERYVMRTLPANLQPENMSVAEFDMSKAVTDDDTSDDEEVPNTADEEFLVSEADMLQLGKAQMRKGKHKGTVPNGKMHLSFLLSEDKLTVKVISMRGLWNFSSGDIVIKACILVDKRLFMTETSAPVPGSENLDINWDREFQKQAVSRVFQVSVFQKGARHMLRRTAKTVIGQVLVDMSKLDLQEGEELNLWYPILSLRHAKVYKKGKTAGHHQTMAHGGISALILPSVSGVAAEAMSKNKTNSMDNRKNTGGQRHLSAWKRSNRNGSNGELSRTSTPHLSSG